MHRRGTVDDRRGLAAGGDDDDAYWAASPNAVRKRVRYVARQLAARRARADHPIPTPPPPSPATPPAPSPTPPTPSLVHICLLALQQGTTVSRGISNLIRYADRNRAARRANNSLPAAPPPSPAIPPAPSAPPPVQSAVASADEESSRTVETMEQPVQRRQLREKARKRVGGTGLPGHLHNATEYWFEAAALLREAGVADPYWMPPPGSKLRGPVPPDACELEMMRHVEEIAGRQRNMEHLMKAHQGTVKSESVAAPYQDKNDYMVKANGNLGKQVMSLEEKYASAARADGKLEEEILFLKEKYEAVVEENMRLEKQITDLCTIFLSIKDDPAPACRKGRPRRRRSKTSAAASWPWPPFPTDGPSNHQVLPPHPHPRHQQ